MLELGRLIEFAYQVVLALILVRIVFSWVPDLARWFPGLASVVARLTSPILDPIRRVMPPVGGLDLSPLVALLLLRLVVLLLNEVLLTFL
ncbi:MAG: YggT family protein [Armatimonadetes bacterium]|nr:YggT family protein [Armatimonadota bacterium]